MARDGTAYAHTSTELPWEPLDRHLRWVARGCPPDLSGARDFGEAFGAGGWAELAGLWHDAGKYARAFQDYLRSGGSRGPDHSTAGARLACEALGPAGYLLAYAIAGHHAGLPDWSASGGGHSGLQERLKACLSETEDALARLPASLRDPGVAPEWDWLRSLPGERSTAGLRVAMFVRMLFSCLVDADYLATELYLDHGRAAARRREFLGIGELNAALTSHIDGLTAKADPGRVAQVRAELLDACLAAAYSGPGLFSLTAPTGTGKTLSSLAFALEHARRYGLRRVIYALPFTSITEQTAKVFRDIFAPLGDGIVLEHHSAAAWRAGDENEPQTRRSMLASENWDAPIVVTTNVQLLESLFASRPAACRKLHRIARSVVVLDEAQALPVRLLRPTLTALDELARGYGSSVVLCSATMPALQRREHFRIGFEPGKVREIVPDPRAMAAAMRRVEVERAGTLDDQALVLRLHACPRALCIVNTKAHAAALYEGLVREDGDGAAYHLSAAMCPAHRTEVLDRVRALLKDAKEPPCRLVSTQVVEAGVDIDFPVVFRAMAGLDSIAQASGRCNREGKLDRGRVVVFETDVKPSPGVKLQADAARETLGLHDDPLDLDAVDRYFRLHYQQDNKNEWDGEGIMGLFQLAPGASPFVFSFREAASKYKIIDEQTRPVVVPYGEEGANLCKKLLSGELDRALLRKSQRFTVSV